MDTKLLILSQLGWPPEFNAQILRLSKIAKNLPTYGVDPIVFSPTPHSKSAKDHELYDDTSMHGVKIYYVGRQLRPSLNRSHLAKAFKIFFVPDLKTYFLFYLNSILHLIEKEDIKYILTSTPPSGLILGYFIKRRLREKIRWIADFADPWTLNHFYFSPSPIHKKFEGNLERKIMLNADAITFASEFQMKKYLEKYPFIEGKAYWLPNGYDEEDFEGITPIKFDKFTFLHMGTIYRQFALSFLDIFAKLEKKYDFQLLFIGNIAPTKLEEIKSKNLKSIKILGPQLHKKVIQYLLSADALIFNLEYDFINVLPSRLPEYLRAKTPILAFISHRSLSAKIISSCKIGYIIDKPNLEKGYKIAESLIKGDLKISPNDNEIEKFSWEKISSELAVLIRGGLI